ncbi:HNH endonuclease [Pseudomonas aeruginosa]
MPPEICMFCENLAGSEEHIFLSSLGGRAVTRRATCTDCNNSFANDETGKIDDALAEALILVRNALKIWTGRDRPPPTIQRAGTMEEGGEFDLAPGLVPLVRAARIPSEFAEGQTIVARDAEDVRRVKDILEKRKLLISAGQATLVTKKVPSIKLSTYFDGNKVWRCIAKTAVVGFVVLYGNERAKAVISPDLLSSIRYGTPPIAQFAGWDYASDWPVIENLKPHKNSQNSVLSGFEHSLVIAEVQERLVAYVELFGGWRFSVNLGPKAGLPLKGLAVNPCSLKPSRFEVDGIPPDSYIPRTEQSYQNEHLEVMAQVKTAFDRIMQKWSTESSAQYVQDLTDELINAVSRAGDDEIKRQKVIDDFAAKLVLVECGEAWETDLDTVLNEDY